MDSFEENLHEIYDRKVDVTDKDDCLVYCEILLTLAFGQMYSVNQWTSNDGPPGFEYFQQAMQLLPGLHEQGSVTFIKVLSLVGYFFQNLNRRDAAFLYVRDIPLRIVFSNMDRLAWHCVWQYQWGYIRRFPIRILTTGLENTDGGCGGRCTVWIGR